MKAIHNKCVTHHRFFRTLVSFDSAFSSKEGAPLDVTHFQVLFSIFKGDQELFGNQLLVQFGNRFYSLIDALKYSVLEDIELNSQVNLRKFQKRLCIY